MRRVLEAMPLPSGLHTERIQWRYDGLAIPASASSTTHKYLVYWMQTSVRARFNYALEYAIAAANHLALPLHVVYFLSDRSVVPRSYAPRDPNAFGVATARHAKFTVEGLASITQTLHARGLSFQVLLHHHHPDATTTGTGSRSRRHPPIAFWIDQDKEDEDAEEDDEATTRSDLLDQCARNAALVITDRPYLRPWREALDKCVDGAKANAREWGLVQVEGDVVVPCEAATTKEEYAARTIRPKIHAQLKKYLVPLHHGTLDTACHTAARPLPLPAPVVTLDMATPTMEVLGLLDVDRNVAGVHGFLGGEVVAQQALRAFLDTNFSRYATDRNEPSGDGGSNLSLYLRHGHVSPVDITLQTTKHVGSHKESKESFLEELIVRRELAVNMCVFNDNYDTMACLPEYATITLHEHAKDKRDHLYDVHALEQGKTLDVYWNAAQLEMVHTGKMHGYMRMYWAKKILEWTTSPQLGFRIALYLNNKFALDAPDPNSYTGIAWSFGKHDQGWKERPIFGKVRYMNESGLKRKFRMDAYVAKVKRLAAEGGGGDSGGGGRGGGASVPTVPAYNTTKTSTTKATTKRKKSPASKDKGEEEAEDLMTSMAKKQKALEAYFASKNK